MASENRLIDAVKLVIKLAKKVRFGRIEYDDVLAVIADAPTVDAMQVAHGRWMDDHGDYECSVCCSVYSAEVIYMNKDCMHDVLKYCPNCGAKMDGGHEDG